MRIILFGALLLFMAACGGGSEESSDRKDGYSQKATTPEDSLFEDIMHAHDTAMPKMGRLRGSVARIDSLKKAKSADPSAQKEYSQLSAELTQAAENMDRWMTEFVHDSAQNDPQKRIEYLSSEKVKVTKVKDEIFAALAKADSALKK